MRIEHEPIEIRCRRCGRQSRVAELALWCPECQATDVEVVAGRSFRVRSLEVE